MAKLQLMQVAINDYDPASKVSALEGCIKDINTFYDYLKQDFAHLFDDNNPPLRFINDGAKREKVIAGFLDLAERTQPDDFVLIQFSGHGSQSVAAEELWDRSSTKKYDECFLLYDSRLPEGYDLADKEIAQLLSKFPPEVDIVFIADCCHAGTITRKGEDIELRARYHGVRTGGPRPLHSYYGYDSKSLQVPESNNIGITACSGKERAYEREQGVFTKALIEELKATKGQISYAALFERLRNKVNQIETAQTPQFDIVGKFNSHRLFLSKVENKAEHYPLIYDNASNEWKLMRGAVHGLSEDMQLNLEIRPSNNPDATSKYAKVKEIRMAHCVLDDFDIEGRNIPRQAKIISILKPSLQVDLIGDPQMCTDFRAQFNPGSVFITTGFFTNSKYQIKLNRQDLDNGAKNYSAELYQSEANKLIHTIVNEPSEYELFKELKAALQLVENWERLLAVNSNSPLLRGKFAWHIELENIEHSEAELNIKLDQNTNQKIIDRPFKIWATNLSETPLYFTLLQFNRNYSILPFKPAQDVSPQDVVLLRDERFTIKGSSPVSKLIFKLIVSTTPLDLAPFDEKGHLNLGNPDYKISVTRDTPDEPMPSLEAWQTDHKVVNLTRT